MSVGAGGGWVEGYLESLTSRSALAFAFGSDSPFSLLRRRFRIAGNDAMGCSDQYGTDQELSLAD